MQPHSFIAPRQLLHFFALAHKEEARAEKLNFQSRTATAIFSAARALKPPPSYLDRVKFLLYEITYKQVIISDFSLCVVRLQQISIMLRGSRPAAKQKAPESGPSKYKARANLLFSICWPVAHGTCGERERRPHIFSIPFHIFSSRFKQLSVLS